MGIFKISAGLGTAFRQQRRSIFGNKRYWFHIGFWMLAVMLLGSGYVESFDKGFKVGIGTGSNRQASDVLPAQVPYWYIYVLGTLAASLMVYNYLLFVIPYAKYKRKKRYLWLGLIVNGAIWLILIMSSAMTVGYLYGTGNEITLKNNPLLFIVLISSIFSGIGAGYFFSVYYFLDLYDQQKHLNAYKKILTEKMQAETNFLKSQINPHFLFNTLNNIYSLTLSRSKDAPLIAGQLKALLSYMLYDCSKESVRLEGEITFLRNYLDLETLRNRNEEVDIRMEVRGDPADKGIAPLLLINFVENAFKHGVKSGIGNAFVHLSLALVGNRLSMEISNSKPENADDRKMEIKQDGGIGIYNVKRRLAILYPGRHKLRIWETEKEYNVYLTIDL
ncbi:MAG TPA: sensor histidine kinase [Chitinophagaceae bacterium]|nr:sensor histidine kinase [Chitinophagaceae bacterium]